MTKSIYLCITAKRLACRAPACRRHGEAGGLADRQNNFWQNCFNMIESTLKRWELPISQIFTN